VSKVTDHGLNDQCFIPVRGRILVSLTQTGIEPLIQ